MKKMAKKEISNDGKMMMILQGLFSYQKCKAGSMQWEIVNRISRNWLSQMLCSETRRLGCWTTLLARENLLSPDMTHSLL